MNWQKELQELRASRPLSSLGKARSKTIVRVNLEDSAQYVSLALNLKEVRTAMIEKVRWLDGFFQREKALGYAIAPSDDPTYPVSAFEMVSDFDAWFQLKYLDYDLGLGSLQHLCRVVENLAKEPTDNWTEDTIIKYLLK